MVNLITKAAVSKGLTVLFGKKISVSTTAYIAGRVAGFYASNKAQDIAEHLEVRREISDAYYVERRFYNGKDRVEAFCVTAKRHTPPPSESPVRVDVDKLRQSSKEVMKIVDGEASRAKARCVEYIVDDQANLAKKVWYHRRSVMG